MRANKIPTKKIVYFAILLALVVVLQFVGSYIKIGPVSISLVLVPIVLGGLLLGCAAGVALGFSFGMITFIAGVAGLDPFTFALFQATPFMTFFICIVKATAAGFFPALFYKLIAKKHPFVGAYVAAASAPIINTGIFILGSLMISKTLREVVGLDESISMIYFLVVMCAGINFLVELGINILLAPAIYKIIQIVEGKVSKKKVASQSDDDIDEGNYEQEDEREDSINE